MSANVTSSISISESTSVKFLSLSIKVPEKLKQRPFYCLSVALLKSIFIIFLPYIALIILLNYFETISLNTAKIQQEQELTNLLSQIAGDSDPLRYFNKEFTALANLPFTFKYETYEEDKAKKQKIVLSSDFNKRLNEILDQFESQFGQNNNSKTQLISMSFYDKNNKIIKELTHWKSGVNAANKFVSFILDPKLCSKKLDQQIAKTFSGYANAHETLHNALDSVVELGLSDENRWGGYFTLKDEQNKKSGSFVVFIKKDINPDFLLPNVLKKAQNEHIRNTLLAWQEPSQDINQPNEFLPKNNGFSEIAIKSFNEMPIGENIVYIDYGKNYSKIKKNKNDTETGKKDYFFINRITEFSDNIFNKLREYGFALDDSQKKHCGVKIFTDSGVRLIGENVTPAHADYMYKKASLTLTVIAAFAFIATVYFMLGLSSFVPGFRFKMAMLIIFGALVSLSMLLFTGLAYSNEIENNLKNEFQQAHIEEMTRIDEDILNDYGIIERSFSEDIHAISPTLPEHQMSERAQKVFATTDVSQLNNASYTGDIKDFKQKYPFIRKLIFATENQCLSFDELKDAYNSKKPDSNSFEAYIMSLIKIANGEAVSDEGAASGNVMSGMGNVLNTNVLLNTGKISNMNMVSSGLTYIELLRDKKMRNKAIVYIFMKDFMIQKSYLLKMSHKRDEQIKKSPLSPRFAAIPVSKTKDWRAFPNISTATDPNLTKLADQAYKSMAPVHSVTSINNKRYLISSIPGNNLSGYSLLMATPYIVITNAIKAERKKIMLNAFFIAIIALLTAYFSSSILLNSMGKLQEGLRTIANGDFRKRMDDSPIAEFSSMIGSLNNTMYQLGELKVAKSVQETLLPDKGLSGEDWELCGQCRTATDLGGDHIDWLQLTDGRILIIIGDVTGHGIAPAMVQASMKVWLALHAETAQDSVSLVKEINRLHINHGAKRFNMTAWFGYYTPQTGELEFTSAGHPYPMLLKEDGSIEMLKLPGMPIGSTLRIRLKSEKITMEPGSSLILYTDGFAEIKNHAGQLLGFDGFAKICSSTKGMDAMPAINSIFEQAKMFGEQNDDQTVVILRRKKI